MRYLFGQLYKFRCPSLVRTRWGPCDFMICVCEGLWQTALQHRNIQKALVPRWIICQLQSGLMNLVLTFRLSHHRCQLQRRIYVWLTLCAARTNPKHLSGQQTTVPLSVEQCQPPPTLLLQTFHDQGSLDRIENTQELEHHCADHCNDTCKTYILSRCSICQQKAPACDTACWVHCNFNMIDYTNAVKDTRLWPRYEQQFSGKLRLTSQLNNTMWYALTCVIGSSSRLRFFKFFFFRYCSRQVCMEANSCPSCSVIFSCNLPWNAHFNSGGQHCATVSWHQVFTNQ